MANYPLSEQSKKKCARILALANAISEGYINPDTVNISDLSRMFNLNRSTILKDLLVCQDVLELSREYESLIVNNPPSTSEQWRN